MKIKTILLSVFCFCTITTFGQIAKGNLIIGGSAGLQSITNKFENSNSSTSNVTLFLGPQITYFISDRFAAGGSILLGSGGDSGGNFGVSGNARFYLSNESSSAWFLKAELQLAKSGGFSQVSGNTGLGWDVFFSPNIALESTMTIGFSDDNTFSNGNVVQFRIGTGLKFFFDRFPEELPEDRNIVIRKGNRYLGLSSGSILLNRRNNVNTSSINLSPSIGKFTSDQLLFGLNLNLSNLSAGGFNSFSIAAVPFFRYYLDPTDRKLVPFGEVGAGISFNYINSDFLPTGNQTQSSPIIFGGVGVAYFIRPTVAFEVKANYTYTKQSNIIKQNAIGLNLGFNFFLDRS